MSDNNRQQKGRGKKKDGSDRADVPSTKIRKAALIKSLRASLGIVSTACLSAGIHRATFYDWIDTDAEFKREFESISEEALDYTESKLFERIQGKDVIEKTFEYLVDKKTGKREKTLVEEKIKHVLPDTTAIIFHLKTKGKKRGYIEKQEIDLQASLSVLVGDEDPPEDLPG